MKPPTRKKCIRDSSLESNPSIPEEILHHAILPRLPFKTLKRFQCVSNTFRSLIGSEAFASEQARLLSPSSSCFVQLTKNGISFLTYRESNGLPDPSLKFLGFSCFNLLCSANGLLLNDFIEDCSRKLCLYNPATQEKAFVPTAEKETSSCYSHIGLAFDPHISLDCYIIVDPIFHKAEGRLGFRFEIFRSDTGKWRKSNQKVYVDEPYLSRKTVHSQGVVYWYRFKYILFYDTKKDLADILQLPAEEGKWCIGVHAGQVVVCNVWEAGLEVWRLNDGARWDRVHCVSWDEMAVAYYSFLGKHQLKEQPSVQISFEFHSGKVEACNFVAREQGSLEFCKWHAVRPLGFDGQSIYIAARENGLKKHDEKVFRYSIGTQKLEQKGEMIFRQTRPEYLDSAWFNYDNSMVSVPQVFGRIAN